MRFLLFALLALLFTPPLVIQINLGPLFSGGDRDGAERIEIHAAGTYPGLARFPGTTTAGLHITRLGDQLLPPLPSLPYYPLIAPAPDPPPVAVVERLRHRSVAVPLRIARSGNRLPIPSITP